MTKPATVGRRLDFVDIEELRNHPKVVRILEMPYDYLLVDFWDDWYRKIYNPKIRYYEDPVLRAKAAELRVESDALLKPLFERATDGNFVTGMGFQINESAYDIKLLRREGIVKVRLDSAIPKASSIDVHLLLRKRNERSQRVLDKLLDDWRAWAIEKQLLRTVEVKEDEDLKRALSVEPLEGFEDALAALVVMSRELRGKAGIAEVVF